MNSKSVFLKKLNNKFRIFSDINFRDLSKFPARKRTANSKVLNFYSAANNIGNYLPVMAIHNYLGESIDCWNVHDRNIDFEFINKNYKFIIIGGAGLLHPCFEHFWISLKDKCRIPYMIWGVGACLPDILKESDKNIYDFFEQKNIRQAISRAELINFRDEWTVELVGAQDATITPCPTLKLLSNYAHNKSRVSKTKSILYAPHYELMSSNEESQLHSFAKSLRRNVKITENNELPWQGMWSLINNYIASDLVVTSRLHGAIIAWSLNIPFIALSKDKKMSEFCRLFSMEGVAENIDDLRDTKPCHSSKSKQDVFIDELDQFAAKALTMIGSYAD